MFFNFILDFLLAGFELNVRSSGLRHADIQLFYTPKVGALILFLIFLLVVQLTKCALPGNNP